jgi:TPR repeat protein
MTLSDREQIEHSAAAGDVKSQIYLGWAHDRNGAYEYNATLAEDWLERAAQSNNLEALRRLTRFQFDRGNEKCISNITKLNQLGDFYGHYVLGHIYLDGACGIDADKQKALRQFETAAKLGHLISTFDYLRNNLSRHFLGIGTVFKLVLLSGKIMKIHMADEKDLRIYR